MKKLFAPLALLALSLPALANASVMRNENIAASDNIGENVYLMSANPVAAGTVQGDLVASGGNISVTGAVVQDALLAGGNVNVTGRVGGDLRVFSGSLMLDGEVDGELLVYSGSVVIGPHAMIQGDVNIGAGEVQVDPAAKMMSTKINIKTGEKAKADISPRTFLIDTNQFLSGAFWVTQIVVMGGVLLVVFLLHFLVPNFTKKFVQASWTGTMFWKNFLVGLLMLIVMPIAAIICFFTGVGALLGGLILIAYLGFIIAGVVLGGVVFGGMLYELAKKPKVYRMPWWWLVVGVIGLHIISWVPVLGGLVCFAFFLTAMGTLAKVKWGALRGVK